MILFVDDEKLPQWFKLPEDTRHARTPESAWSLWLTAEYDVLYLDHDLGEEMDGSELLHKLCTDGEKPDKVYCVSLNPIGVTRIEWVCKDHDIPFEDIGRKMMFEQFPVIGGQSG